MKIETKKVFEFEEGDIKGEVEIKDDGSVILWNICSKYEYGKKVEIKGYRDDSIEKLSSLIDILNKIKEIIETEKILE